MASPVGVITFSLLLVLLTASSCAGLDFVVVLGRDGHWTTNPAEPRDHFQINDTLVFKYDKDVDAVLSVDKSHHDACNTTEPFLRLEGGESSVVLESSGYYYFISADAERCQAGERLSVVVNDNTPSAPPPKSAPHPAPAPPKPASTTPSSPPPVPSPAAQSVLPPSSPPYPSSAGNASSPSPAPLTTAPVPAGTKNGTGPSSTSASAVALRAGVLACIAIGASAAILR